MTPNGGVETVFRANNVATEPEGRNRLVVPRAVALNHAQWVG